MVVHIGTGMAEDSKPWVVTQVTAVQGPFIKKDWLPVTKTVDDTIFSKFYKFDRNVIMALTGKGLELRSSKQPQVKKLHESYHYPYLYLP